MGLSGMAGVEIRGDAARLLDGPGAAALRLERKKGRF